MFVMAKPGAKPRPEEKSKEALMLHLERSSMAKDGWNLQVVWCLVQLWLEMPVTSMVKNLVILSYCINFDGVISLTCNIL